MRMQVQSLASLSGLRIQHCCELWCRLADLIRPLAWEPPYAAGVALKKKTKKKFKIQKSFHFYFPKKKRPVFKIQKSFLSNQKQRLPEIPLHLVKLVLSENTSGHLFLFASLEARRQGKSTIHYV